MTDDADATPRTRLRDLGLELPVAPRALASYEPVSLSPAGDGRVIAVVAGQVAMRDGRPVRVGAVPEEVSVEDAVDNARFCALNVLAQLEQAVGLENVEKLLQVTVYVHAASAFTEHPRVANGASDLLVAVLGEAGRHSRAAVGVSGLPLRVPVEVSAVAVARGRPSSAGGR